MQRAAEGREREDGEEEKEAAGGAEGGFVCRCDENKHDKHLTILYRPGLGSWMGLVEREAPSGQGGMAWLGLALLAWSVLLMDRGTDCVQKMDGDRALSKTVTEQSPAHTARGYLC